MQTAMRKEKPMKLQLTYALLFFAWFVQFPLSAPAVRNSPFRSVAGKPGALQAGYEFRRSRRLGLESYDFGALRRIHT